LGDAALQKPLKGFSFPLIDFLVERLMIVDRASQSDQKA